MDPIEFIHTNSHQQEAIKLTGGLDWLFWSLILLNLVFIAVSKSLVPGYLSSLLNVGLFNRTLHQYLDDNLRLTGPGSILLVLVYFNNLAIICTLFVYKDFNFNVLIILGAAILLVLLKFFVMWAIMFITKVKGGIREHFYNHLVYFQIAGIIMTPVLVFSWYLPDDYQSMIIKLLLGFVLIMILYREIQSLLRGIRANVAGLYIILYLCTLELMPFVLAIKAFPVLFALLIS